MLMAAHRSAHLANMLASARIFTVSCLCLALTPTALAAGVATPPPAEATAGTPSLEGALALRKAGRFEEALRMIQAWIVEHPDDTAAMHELGVLYAIHGQYREAAGKFQLALTLDPDLRETRRNLAEVLRADGQYAGALVHYQILWPTQVDDAVAAKGQVLCLQALGRFDEAMSLCTLVISKQPATPLAEWMQARAAILQQRKDRGSVDPQQMDAEGQALFTEKRYADAAQWFAMALTEMPTAERAYHLAMAQLGAGDSLAAQGSLQRALQLDSGHLPSASAYPTVAKAVRLQGRGAKEIAFGKVRRAAIPAIAQALDEGDLVLARQLINSALPATAPGQPPEKSLLLQTLLAEVLLREGKLTDAAKQFQIVLAQKSTYSLARKGLAAVYVAQGRFDEARSMAQLTRNALELEVNADLQRFAQKRRAEFAHQLQMSLDPGLKPSAALVDQVSDDRPPPPPPPLPAVEPEPAPPAGKAKGKGKAAAVKAAPAQAKAKSGAGK